MQRTTRQRQAIYSTIAKAPGPLSPREILESAQNEVPALGIATVYRNLRLLEDAGQIARVELPGQVPRYEPAGLEHHHHFVCTACSRVFNVLACTEQLKRLVPPGFVLRHHEITLYGLCCDCKDKEIPG